jgi:hypothetical protein
MVSMRTPVVLVTATLTVAILLAASLLIFVGIRGHHTRGGNNERPAERSAQIRSTPDQLT